MFEYIKPDVQIISFMANEKLASENDVENGFQLPSGAEDMSFNESIEDWGI